MTVEGGFDGEAWRLSGAADAASLEWRFASIHEHYHAQLQNTSAWGALCRVLLEHDPSVGARFVAACESVQEAFATWMAVRIVGDTPLESRPSYRRHNRAMNQMVERIPSLYLASHAALAIASVSMQPRALSGQPSTLDSARLADFRRTDVPDRRFARLRTVPPVLGHAVVAATTLIQETGHPAAAEPEVLTAAMFDASWRPVWHQVHRLFYDAVARSLASDGYESLPVEGHVGVAERLITTAGSSRLAMYEPLNVKDAATRTLADIERESFTLVMARPTEKVAATVDPAHMVAAQGADAHLFLRFRWQRAGVDSDRGWSVVLRRTSRVNDTNVVHERAVDESEALRLGSTGLECLSLVPASLLGHVNDSGWSTFATTARSVVLLDISIADSIAMWTGAGYELKATILEAESIGASVPVLICRLFSHDEPVSHVMLRAVSPHAANALLVAAKELSAEGVAINVQASLPELLNAEEHRMTMFAIAHYVGEETTFGGVHPVNSLGR